MPDRPRHAEAGQFLRTRRARLRPDAVGLPLGPRRRAPGLRREEVAVLAHLSPTWYIHLEQGRAANPSSEVLDSVADALRLSEAERRYLHALIEPVASVPSAPLDAANVHAHIRDLVADTNAMPYPVYAVDHRGGLIAWNTHAADWYADFSTDRAPNILWWLLTAPEARARLTHWNTDTREIVARTRFFIGTTAPDPAAEQLVQDLLVASDDFRQWWINHDVADQDIKRRTLTHPQLGQREFNLLVLHPAHDPSISIVFHLPG